MVVLVASVAVIAGLLGWLHVRSRPQRRAEQALYGTSRPDPELVDRPFDPDLCAFCDDARVAACRACSRPTCGAHQPWPAHLFCYPCEAEWQRGARRRGVVITAVVLVAMLVTGAATAALALAIAAGRDTKLVMLGLVTPVAIAGPLYLWLDRRLRRRWKPAGSLPGATVR